MLQTKNQNRDVSKSIIILRVKGNILAVQLIGFPGSRVKRFGQSWNHQLILFPLFADVGARRVETSLPVHTDWV